MRHSFLPTKEQKLFKRDYLYHAFVVGLFLLASAGLIGVVSLFPAYAQIYVENMALNSQFNPLKKDKDVSNLQKIEQELRSNMAQINTLSESFLLPLNSELVQQIVGTSGEVVINSIDIQEMTTSSSTVVLTGIAPTRASLVSFRERLELLAKGNKIDLPISGLAKNKDIPFTIKVYRSQK